MRAEVISAGVFGVSRPVRNAERASHSPTEEVVPHAHGWNPVEFAHEQICNLVRQVFSSTVPQPVRHVVFSAVDPDTDVLGICKHVGEVLAAEMPEDIAVVAEHSEISADRNRDHARFAECSGPSRLTPVREMSTYLRNNLWLVQFENSARNATTLLHYLGQVRREFAYSIVAGQPGERSSQAIAMAQSADGMILVLSAQKTRRITARKIKDVLDAAHVRVLGTVLCDREFPIPEGIYRQL